MREVPSLFPWWPQIETREFLKIENEQSKTALMDEKLRETTNLGVEIMNSKRQVKGETWSRGTNLVFVVWRKRDA